MNIKALLILLLCCPAFGMTQLDTENADRDLTSIVTVLTDTPDTSNPVLCQAYIALGDGTKNLDETGGNFEFTITIGGQTIQPDVETIVFSTAARSAFWSDIFPCPANKEVILRVKSPNGADTDVDVTAYLYDVGTNVIEAKLPTNNIMGSATKADQDTIIHGGTVPDNTSTEDSIKLAAGASGANDIYNENLVVLISGTGSGQARLIADYIGGTQTAVVRHSWIITPDNTTVYRIYPFSGILLVNTGLVAGATSTSLTLNTSAPATADIYDGHTVYISGGTGEGQARLITGYTAERVATVYPAWDVTPAAAASVYIILPIGVGEIYDTVADILADTDELQTDHADGGRLDLIWDAIKAVTDMLPALVTDVSDSNDANSFTLTAGVADDDAYEGMVIVVQDADDSHYEARAVKSWTSARVVVVDEPYAFTPAVSDNVWIMNTAYPGFIGRLWDIIRRIPYSYNVYDYTGTTSRGRGTIIYDALGEDP